MDNSTNKRNTLKSLNAHMIVALLSIFIAGIALICIGFLFGTNLDLIINTNWIIILFQWLAIITTMLGLLLILLGVFQSIGITKRIKGIFDIILSGKSIGLIGGSKTEPKGRSGLNIIRPPLKESQPEQAPKGAQVKDVSRIQTEKALKTKPTPTPVSEGKNEPAKEESLDISLEEALQKIVDRYNDPKVSKAFSSWNETLMMTFPDKDKSYLYKINYDKGIDLEEGYDEEAAVQVKLSSEIFIKMMTKQINPIKAYSSGELEVSGKMRNLLKLRKLMF